MSDRKPNNQKRADAPPKQVVVSADDLINLRRKLIQGLDELDKVLGLDSRRKAA